jgi:hypothetical protein
MRRRQPSSGAAALRRGTVQEQAKRLVAAVSAGKDTEHRSPRLRGAERRRPKTIRGRTVDTACCLAYAGSDEAGVIAPLLRLLLCSQVPQFAGPLRWPASPVSLPPRADSYRGPHLRAVEVCGERFYSSPYFLLLRLAGWRRSRISELSWHLSRPVRESTESSARR